MDLIKLLLILSLLSIIPGQLVRVPFLNSAAVTISDALVFVTVSIALFYLLAVRKSLKLEPKITTGAVAFSVLAAASTILALSTFSPNEILTSALFLLRFILYFSISIVVFNVVKKSQIESWLNLLMIVGAVFVILGFLQLLIFPDLTFLTPYGWDPHQRRIVSTFIDPNFSGGFLSIIFALSTGLFLEKRKLAYLFFSVIIFAAIIFTFSRSSYLAVFTVLIIVGLMKSPKLLIGFLAISLLAYLTVPQVKARIIGAATFDETSQARVESWHKAITIFTKNPAFGVGFNTYRFAQSRYGLFSFDDPQGGHSGGGSDSSILLVAATTGIVGLTFYLFLLLAVFDRFKKNAAKSALHLGALSSFLGLMIHSQFVNSLFFPQIMLTLWFILGLTLSYDS